MLLLRSAVAGAGSLAALAAARCDAADTRSRPATEAEIAEAKALFAASQQRSTAPTANCMFASNQDMATLLSLTSRSLVDARGRPVDGATLKNKVVGLYFGKKRGCPPCTQFAPVLARFHEAANAAALDAKGATATSAAAAAAGADDEAAKRQPTEPGIEIVFVSCDIEDVGDAGSPPPPWLKVAHGDAYRTELHRLLGPQPTVPRLIVLGIETPIGRPIVDADARAAVETAVASSDMSCVDAWRELNEKCAAMAYTYYTQLLF